MMEVLGILITAVAAYLKWLDSIRRRPPIPVSLLKPGEIPGQSYVHGPTVAFGGVQASAGTRTEYYVANALSEPSPYWVEVLHLRPLPRTVPARFGFWLAERRAPEPWLTDEPGERLDRPIWLPENPTSWRLGPLRAHIRSNPLWCLAIWARLTARPELLRGVEMLILDPQGLRVGFHPMSEAGHVVWELRLGHQQDPDRQPRGSGQLSRNWTDEVVEQRLGPWRDFWLELGGLRDPVAEALRLFETILVGSELYIEAGLALLDGAAEDHRVLALARGWADHPDTTFALASLQALGRWEPMMQRIEQAVKEQGSLPRERMTAALAGALRANRVTASRLLPIVESGQFGELAAEVLLRIRTSEWSTSITRTSLEGAPNRRLALLRRLADEGHPEAPALSLPWLQGTPEEAILALRSITTWGDIRMVPRLEEAIRTMRRGPAKDAAIDAVIRLQSRVAPGMGGAIALVDSGGDITLVSDGENAPPSGHSP